MNSEEVKAFLREKTCLACGKGPVDLHHIKTRKSGGKDYPWNIIPLSRDCHTEWHYIGPSRFLKKYPHVEVYLKALGWETSPKLWHSAN